MKLEKLSCRKRVALLCDFLDKQGTPAQRRVVAAHRSSCRPCRELLASLTRTVKTLRRLKRGRAPAASRRAWRAALRGRSVA